MNVPPIVREVDAHPGRWPAAGSLASCEPANIVLTVVKLAEEGDDLILRGYETAGRETEAEITKANDQYSGKIIWLERPTYPPDDDRGMAGITEEISEPARKKK